MIMTLVLSGPKPAKLIVAEILILDGNKFIASVAVPLNMILG